MNKEDFRIKELYGVFIIERRELIKKYWLGFILISKKFEWCPHVSNRNTFSGILSNKYGFDTIEEAKNKLEKYFEEPKYHYL